MNIRNHKLLIILSPQVWEPIWQHILREIGPRATISWALKREMGFTVRHHRNGAVENDNGWMVPNIEIHLDFYDEAMQTFFIMKYL